MEVKKGALPKSLCWQAWERPEKCSLGTASLADGVGRRDNREVVDLEAHIWFLGVLGGELEGKSLLSVQPEIEQGW